MSRLERKEKYLPTPQQMVAPPYKETPSGSFQQEELGSQMKSGPFFGQDILPVLSPQPLDNVPAGTFPPAPRQCS